MNGIIFIELGAFVESKLGPGAWKKLLEEAGLGFPLYVPIQDYPDQDAMTLIAAAARLTGTEPQALLDAFGEFIVPDLVKTFGHLINPAWRTLDLIEHTTSRSGAPRPTSSPRRSGACGPALTR